MYFKDIRYGNKDIMDLNIFYAYCRPLCKTRTIISISTATKQNNNDSLDALEEQAAIFIKRQIFKEGRRNWAVYYTSP